MIALIRRALVAAITPPSAPPSDAPGLVTVKGYTRKAPVNAKREALHAAMGLDLSAFRASRSIPTEGRQRPAGQRVAS